MQPSLRLGFIIAAHHKPEMVIRLVRRLYSPAHGFFIHYNQRSSDHEYARLMAAFSDLSNVHFLKRQKCRWGDRGLILAALEGIQAMAAQGFVYDYALLLTGQDYPIKSNEHIMSALTQADGASFMEATAWPIPHWEKGRAIRRIHNFHVQLPFPSWTRRLGWPASWQHLALPARRKIPGALHPYFGSSWWCLSRPCLRYIQDYLARHPDYLRFFKYVYAPDECFFQVLLMNSPLAANIHPRTLTYVDWSRKPFPAILNQNDLPCLLQSDCLFARKFDFDADVSIGNQLDAAHHDKSAMS